MSHPKEFKLLLVTLILFLIFAIIMGASDKTDYSSRTAGTVFGVAAFGLGFYLLYRFNKGSPLGALFRSAEHLEKEIKMI